MLKSILKRIFLISFAFVLISGINFGFGKFRPVLAQTYTQARDWINSYGDPNFNDDKIKVLADIQPGTGVLMQELARRFTALFHAARGGNWDLANYQLKEMREVIEVNVVTRPKRKDALESFEESSLGAEENPLEGTLQDVINKKNFVAFNKSFKSAINSCNGCHQASGFGYIKYRLPRSSELPLQFTENVQK